MIASVGLSARGLGASTGSGRCRLGSDETAPGRLESDRASLPLVERVYRLYVEEGLTTG